MFRVKCFKPWSSSNLLNLLLFYVRVMPSFLYRQPEMHWKKLQSTACKWSQNSIHPLKGIAGPLRILTCICCQFVCCKEQKLEETTTKNQTLQDLENPCIYMYRLHCMISYYIFHLVLIVYCRLRCSIHNSQKAKFAEGIWWWWSARSSWMPWQQRKGKHLRISFLTGQSTTAEDNLIAECSIKVRI